MYAASPCIIGAVTLLVLLLGNTAAVRVCVTDEGVVTCQDMLKEPRLSELSLQCVPGPDRYTCLKKLAVKQVDVVAVTGEDVFLARELYDLQVQLVAETRDAARQTEPWQYRGVAVVRRSRVTGLEDLRGAKSCHTGYGRTAGWNIPFSHLLEKNLVKMECGSKVTVVEHDIKAASSFFGLACVPGDWAPDNETDFRLKQQYNNLCAMCGFPERCGSEDPHSGYKGALTCLVDNNADVAWTKMSAVEEFFRERTSVDEADYGLLCPDGRVVDLGSNTRTCHWASKPWNGWLVRSSNENKKGILAALTKIISVASSGVRMPSSTGILPWAKTVLGITKPSVIHTRSPPVSTRDYLKEHKYDTTIERLGCPEEPVKLCLDSQLAVEKCQALSHVLRSRRIRPRLQCVTASDNTDCLAMVESNDAQITTADGGDIYRAHKNHKLIPVVTERYGLQDASYFAVAVVRANSGINSLSQLRGKKSCHTGIGRTAGWKIPVATLLEAGLLTKGNCDFAGEMGRFFSQSCVPGAKDTAYDPLGTNPTNLCDLCVGSKGNGMGSSEGKCDRGPSEAYSGYTGAFRCLAEGAGDVAFVKHTTVRDNSNGNNNASWAANLRAVDFKLLCRDTGSADVVDYNTCHLARVPAHKVLMGPNLSTVMKEEIRILLLHASSKFPRGQDVFHMFGTFNGKQDLIFKDSATALVNVRMDTFHLSLDDTYYLRTLAPMDACEPKGTSKLYADGAGTLYSVPVHLLLSLVLTWLLTH